MHLRILSLNTSGGIMTRLKRKVESANSRLNQKTKTARASDIFSTPTIKQPIQLVNSLLGQARYVPVCFSCGASKNLTKYHGAGGILGVCDLCNGGGIK